MNTLQDASPTPQGTIVISLDFELFWGMHDVATIEEYGEHVLGVRNAIPGMLDLFRTYDIHATWATVGMLACPDRATLERVAPPVRPRYTHERFSTYTHIASGAVGANEEDDPYHFGASLLAQIRNTPHQEIGCHTFSHYYCLEEGADVESFRADLRAWSVAVSGGAPARSIVFPRNQVSPLFLEVCREMGILVYRGAQSHPLYDAVDTKGQYRITSRILRLLDSYANLTGHHTYPVEAQANAPLNVPASRFLRPYTPTLAFLDSWKVKRITEGLSHAAEHGHVFHLWWHPHNFGRYTQKNLTTLETILAHVARLRDAGLLQSRSMGELYESAV